MAALKEKRDSKLLELLILSYLYQSKWECAKDWLVKYRLQSEPDSLKLCEILTTEALMHEKLGLIALLNNY